MAVKKFKCPICKKIYVEKASLYSHMENKHSEELGDLSPAHYYFNAKYHKDTGRCVICHRPTKFNENTERYERFDRPICKKKYVEQFNARMKNKYGKTRLTDDPEQQKKMLANRRISGKYRWSDGQKIPYVGTYEKDCLEFLDNGLNMDSKDVIAPAPKVFPYKYKGKKHFYIPDILLVPYNLYLEIKGSNKGYRDQKIGKEIAKDKMMEKRKDVNYLKILDKNYDELVNTIKKIKDKDSDRV